MLRPKILSQRVVPQGWLLRPQNGFFQKLYQISWWHLFCFEILYQLLDFYPQGELQRHLRILKLIIWYIFITLFATKRLILDLKVSLNRARQDLVLYFALDPIFLEFTSNFMIFLVSFCINFQSFYRCNCI